VTTTTMASVTTKKWTTNLTVSQMTTMSMSMSWTNSMTRTTMRSSLVPLAVLGITSLTTGSFSKGRAARAVTRGRRRELRVAGAEATRRSSADARRRVRRGRALVRPPRLLEDVALHWIVLFLRHVHHR